jgi:hypothetical protein
MRSRCCDIVHVENAESEACEAPVVPLKYARKTLRDSPYILHAHRLHLRG